MSGRDANRGFTLLEVLVAMTILGMAVAVLIQLAAANARSISASEDAAGSALAAEAAMRGILERKDLPGGGWREQTEDGRTLNVTVTEMLAERTERLPLKLLRIDLVMTGGRTGRTRPVVLRAVKLVERPVADGNADRQKS